MPLVALFRLWPSAAGGPVLLAVQLHSCIPVSLHYMDTGASMFAEVYVGADMCVDMCVNMCINMCLDMCGHVHRRVYGHLCKDMCMDMCVETCEDMRIDNCPGGLRDCCRSAVARLHPTSLG